MASACSGAIFQLLLFPFLRILFVRETARKTDVLWAVCARIRHSEREKWRSKAFPEIAADGQKHAFARRTTCNSRRFRRQSSSAAQFQVLLLRHNKHTGGAYPRRRYLYCGIAHVTVLLGNKIRLNID
jgi:hypothetical protein